jgi:ligand-binding SRPBCC domain-containing protein
MPTFNYAFTVHAPATAVSAFHADTRALKTLTPPPIFAQIHHADPLADGAIADFTLWFGPLPVRWRAIHSQVSAHGFTDTQLSGPLAHWQHRHTFIPLDEQTTRIQEQIEYAHFPGQRGWLSRLLFARPALFLLFTARQFITRWHLELNPAQRQRFAGLAAVGALSAVIALWRSRS